MYALISWRCGPRRLWCGVLAVLLVFAVAACSGKAATPSPTVPPPPPPQPTRPAVQPTAPVTQAAAAPAQALPTSATAFYALAQKASAMAKAQVLDVPSGMLAQRTLRGMAPLAGDDYSRNVYERPFNAQTQSLYFPDLDVYQATLVQSQDWYILGLRLYGLRDKAAAPQGDYALEIDVNRDGRGDYFVRAQGPLGQPDSWSTSGIEVRQDKNQDVEGKQVCQSDAPLQGDGYETVVYPTAAGKPGLVQVMWTWESGLGNRKYPLVLLAVHRSLLNGADQGILWQAWADGGIRDPQRMAFHDIFSLKEAGEPYTDSPNYPIKAIAQVDSTCRGVLGFQPTGDEPCLCPDIAAKAAAARGTPAGTAQTCSGQSQPDLSTLPEACFGHRLGDEGYWWCYGDDKGEFVTVRWNADTCQWEPASEACREEDALQASNCALGAEPDTMECNGVLYAANECYYFLDTCEVECLGDPIDQCEAPDLCVQLTDGDDVWQCDDGVWEQCEYDGCQWQCGAQVEACEPQDLCVQVADGTWRCEDTGEEVWDTCTYGGCFWECDVVRTGGDDTGGDVGGGDACEDPGACWYDEALDSWGCDDGSLWGSCNYDGCNWYCEGPPAPSLCEDPGACWYEEALGGWQCDDGSQWGNCNYDGCYWYCEGEPAPPPVCEDPGACWYEEALGGWQCDDGSQWGNCNYDGCYWYCEGEPAPPPVCEDPNACWFDVVMGIWQCEDGSTWNICNYDGCYWICE